MEHELQSKDLQIAKLEEQMAKVNHAMEAQTLKVRVHKVFLGCLLYLLVLDLSLVIRLFYHYGY